MVASGVSTWQSVSPGWPFWPPVFLPDDSRRLLTRGGFFSPSLDGGLPLFVLFSPSRRSNSATRAKSASLSLTRCSICTCKAAMVGWSTITVDVGLRQGGPTRTVSQTPLDSDPAVTCQAIILEGALGCYDLCWRLACLQLRLSMPMAPSC
jgi:hypothetical protein